jgi:hypothetical protein
MAKLSATLLCIAALLLASNCHAARPDRHLAQAIANANSVAGPGETVVSRSGATSEDGDLTVSDVSASGAGPSTTVTCEQQAASGQVLSEECGGDGETTAVTPTAAGPKAEPKAETEADATAVTKPAPAAKPATPEVVTEVGLAVCHKLPPRWWHVVHSGMAVQKLLGLCSSSSGSSLHAACHPSELEANYKGLHTGGHTLWPMLGQCNSWHTCMHDE